MKKLIPHLPHYISTGILLLSSFGVAPNSVVSPLSAETDSTTTTTTNDNLSETPSAPLPDSGDEPPLYDFTSDLIIKAFNPGYSVGTDSDVGEFIELLNLTNAPFALAGYRLVYTGSGKPSTIFTFPENSFLTGKHLLFRFDKSPETDFDLSYKLGTHGLAQDYGKLELFSSDSAEPVDQVCWTTAKDSGDCIRRIKDEGQTIVRDLTKGTFKLVIADEYETPAIDPDQPNLDLPEPPTDEPSPDDELSEPQCLGLEFSELLTYYATDKSEQFIELFNPTDADIPLDGCKISYKNKSYQLTGQVLSGGYYAYHPNGQFALTKNPTKPLILGLIDVNGEVIDEIAYPKGQKSSTSFAKFVDVDGNESWEITYSITPGQANQFQKFRNCEAGKIINEATGNCVKAPVISDEAAEESTTKTKTLAECPAGQYRNPLTNRCKKIATATSTTLAACPAGQYRNPLTNRCKKITTTSATTKECAAGYERNPETNRCRKIKSTSGNDGTDYAVTPTVKSDKTSFVGLGIVLLIALLGLVYVVLQFRREILRAARKAGQRLNHIRQHLFTRKVRRHRNQKP